MAEGQALATESKGWHNAKHSMQVLVTSPIPSHPQDHGNRARVYSLCRTLQKRGYSIHFVYGGLEGLSDSQELAMRKAWEHVYIVPHDPAPRKQSKRNHHLIDDWYVPAVTDITQRILNIWDISHCLANYVWFSRWLEDVPAGIPKYLDTHDMFANRNKSLKREGMKASWYSTTPSEEKKALDRADVVLAIQSSEAKTFRRATDSEVETLGHYVPPHFLDKPLAKSADKIKVGYLASNNPINQHSLHKFTQELVQFPELHNRISFQLAGAICGSDVASDCPFEKLGFVDDVDNFYRDMDIILNPNIGGTGLKIKSVEALSFGKPLIATVDAMIGIETPEPHHQHKTLKSMCKGLLELSETPESIELLGQSGRSIFENYSSAQKAALDKLFPENMQ